VIVLQCGDQDPVALTTFQCGNATIDVGESCDDGNLINGDGCSVICQNECGNAIIDQGEECDAGDANSQDPNAPCRLNCTLPQCGDGIVDQDEECDDGNQNNDDECTSECTEPGFNNGPNDPGQSCLTLKQNDGTLSSGLYWVDPDGGNTNNALEVFCDMQTNGGGWTLISNRFVNRDDVGQRPLSPSQGNTSHNRETDFNVDINKFLSNSSEVAYAVKHGNNCTNCTISSYDSALKVDLNGLQTWSESCTSESSPRNMVKLVGLDANQSGTTYQCQNSLGWGNCDGKVCHYGVHNSSTASDGSWSQNTWNEFHFPSENSSYRDYNGYCRGCSGGLSGNFNGSSTCCSDGSVLPLGRFTMWLR
jgi:cysteine-rich repeat protein